MKKNELFFKENNNFLTKENIEFIEKIILGNNFSWFLSEGNITKKLYIPYLTHCVLKRLDEYTIDQCLNSHFYKDTLDILNNFCKSIEEKPNVYLRMNYNLIFNIKETKPFIHKDHEMPHKQIIIYLNEPDDKETGTYILNEKEEIIKKCIAKKYKGICFGHNKHYALHPKVNHRVILVATFI